MKLYKEIVDKNDRELASLPEGVPGESVRSSVVEEDMSNRKNTDEEQEFMAATEPLE